MRLIKSFLFVSGFDHVPPGLLRRRAICKAILAKTRWEGYLERLRRWRRDCAKREPLGDAPAEIKFLRKLLRRLAGLHYGPQTGEGPRDGFGSQGKVGMRVCNQANWDNATRAIEEDR